MFRPELPRKLNGHSNLGNGYGGTERSHWENISFLEVFCSQLAAAASRGFNGDASLFRGHDQVRQIVFRVGEQSLRQAHHVLVVASPLPQATFPQRHDRELPPGGAAYAVYRVRFHFPLSQLQHHDQSARHRDQDDQGRHYEGKNHHACEYQPPGPHGPTSLQVVGNSRNLRKACAFR